MFSSRMEGKKKKRNNHFNLGYLFVLLLLTFFSSLLESNQNESADKPELKDSLQKYLIITLQKCQGHKNRERLRDRHRLKDTKEM